MAKRDMAKMGTATTGTGTMTIGSAVSGFQSFAAAGIIDGERVTYTIIDGVNWEVGQGVYTVAGTTLSRVTVFDSSSGGSKISLSGSAEVALTTSGKDMGFEAIWDAATTTSITNGSTTQLTLAASDFYFQDYGYVTTATDDFTIVIDYIYRVRLSVKMTSASMFNGGLSLILKVDDGPKQTMRRSYASASNVNNDTFEMSALLYLQNGQTVQADVVNNGGSTVTATILEFSFEPVRHTYYSI